MLFLLTFGTEEEKEKFSILYQDYAEFMQRVARRFLLNSYDAEDAVHDAFLYVAGRQEKTCRDHQGRRESWLNTLSVRKNFARRSGSLTRNRNRLLKQLSIMTRSSFPTLSGKKWIPSCKPALQRKNVTKSVPALQRQLPLSFCFLPHYYSSTLQLGQDSSTGSRMFIPASQTICFSVKMTKKNFLHMPPVDSRRLKKRGGKDRGKPLFAPLSER